MDMAKRKLVIGVVGVALLLLGVLAYAQVNVAHNFDLPEYPNRSHAPTVTAVQE